MLTENDCQNNHKIDTKSLKGDGGPGGRKVFIENHFCEVVVGENGGLGKVEII